MGRITQSCSGCCVWGVDLLILVCVGASEYPFDRLLKMVDELCEEGVIDGENVLGQIANAKYIPQHYKSFRLCSREEFQEYTNKADIVITHAGTGSVIPPLKLGKKVIVVPRREKYKEHLDDHQLELMQVFVDAGYVVPAESKEDLKKQLQKMKEFVPKKFISNNKRMNNLIIDFIEKNQSLSFVRKGGLS